MHRLFWIFCSFLIILTLISTIAGGIRYRENFMDKVLEDVKEVDSNILRTLTHTEVVEEEAVVKTTPPAMPTPTPTPTPKPVQEPPIVKGVQSDLSSNYKVIEPFNGNVYATF